MEKTNIPISGFVTIILFAILFIGAPTAYSVPPDAKMCSFLDKFHGHTCPGSLMGLRLGLAAKEALNAEGRIEAKTFLLACPVDGIQVGAGTTYGNRALTVEDKKEMYLILTDTKTGKQIETRMTEKAMEMGKRYRELSSQKRSKVAGSPEYGDLEKEATSALDWFRTAPDQEVVAIQTLEKCLISSG